MRKNDLASSFELLNPPEPDSEGRQVYTVVRVPWCPAAFIGIDSLSCPAFILKVEELSAQNSLIPFSLINIEVRHKNRVVLLYEGDQSEEGIFSVIRCPSQEPELQNLFIRCISHVLPPKIQMLRVSEVNDLVEHLVNLFRLALEPPKGEILGLWAEMLLITLSTKPRELVMAWRPIEYSHFDFGNISELVEVKATTDATRRHHISYNQANPPEGASSHIVSIVTDEIGRGVTVRSLWEQCVELAGEDIKLAEKVDNNCMRGLGKNWSQSGTVSFDINMAKSSLRAYNPSGIPRITDLPSGVSQVRWVADFSQGEPVDFTNPNYSPMLQSIIDGL